MLIVLKTVLDVLISPEQTGFMKNRQISENIRRTFEVIQYTKKGNIPGIIMRIDFEKCFDKLEFTGIQGALQYFNFGPNFRAWSQLFFANFELCAQNYGFTSRYFPKSRGCNQGCNISPFYYLLCGEIMARKLKQNKEIRGIDVHGINNLIPQFADDTALFLKYSKSCLEAVIRTLSVIENNTGLTVSYDKTLLYRIGSLANSNAKLYVSKNFTWTNEPFSLLGITIANDLTLANNLNFSSSIAKMEGVAESWYYHNCTLMGKILIVNTLMESLFVYKLAVLQDMSKNLIQKVDSIIDRFIWKGKKARIAKKTLQANKRCGGLRLFHVESKMKALKINWISKIRSDTFFNKCFYSTLQINSHFDIFECNFAKKDCVQLVGDMAKDNFWAQTLMHWCEINYKTPQTLNDTLISSIVYNSDIRIDNKVLTTASLINTGITRIEHLCNTDDVDNIYLMNYPAFTEKHGALITWLEYNGILQAIPKVYKWNIENLDRSAETQSDFHWCKIQHNKKIANKIYKTLINYDDHLLRYASKWISTYGLEIDTIKSYASAFDKLYKDTNVIILRDFQYRLLLFKIPLNCDLFAWKIINNDHCSFCGKASETFRHLFLDCEHVDKISSQLSLHLNMAKPNITALIMNNQYKAKDVRSLITLIYKQFIYRYRCQNKTPTYNKLFAEIQLNHDIEIYNARKMMKTEKVIKKWANIFPQEKSI